MRNNYLSALRNFGQFASRQVGSCLSKAALQAGKIKQGMGEELGNLSHNLMYNQHLWIGARYAFRGTMTAAVGAATYAMLPQAGAFAARRLIMTTMPGGSVIASLGRLYLAETVGLKVGASLSGWSGVTTPTAMGLVAVGADRVFDFLSNTRFDRQFSIEGELGNEASEEEDFALVTKHF